jgi:transposase-like protein
MMRKQYTAAFKARVVQELIKEEKTLAQIATEYEVHPTQLCELASSRIGRAARPLSETGQYDGTEKSP